MVFPLNPHWKISTEARHQEENCSICQESCKSSDKQVIICVHETVVEGQRTTLNHPHHLICIANQLSSDHIKFLLSPSQSSHTMPCPTCREPLFSHSILSIDHPLIKKLTALTQALFKEKKSTIEAALSLVELRNNLNNLTQTS